MTGPSQVPLPPSRSAASETYDPKRIVSDAVLAVASATTLEQFVEQLRALRDERKLSLRKIDSASAGKGMSRSTASKMLQGEKLPSRNTLLLFVRACKVSPAEQVLWVKARNQVAEALSRPSHDAPETASPAVEGKPEAPTTPEKGEPPPEVVVPAPREAPKQQLVEQDGNVAPETVTNPLPSPADTPPAPAQVPVDVPAIRSRHVHLLLALALLIAVITASAIAMWLTHVPVEIAVLAYSVIGLCVISWTAINRVLISRIAEHRPPGNRGYDQSDIFLPPDTGYLQSQLARNDKGNAILLGGLHEPFSADDVSDGEMKTAPPVIGDW